MPKVSAVSSKQEAPSFRVGRKSLLHYLGKFIMIEMLNN
jgi:hypothetical protein